MVQQDLLLYLLRGGITKTVAVDQARGLLFNVGDKLEIAIGLSIMEAYVTEYQASEDRYIIQIKNLIMAAGYTSQKGFFGIDKINDVATTRDFAPTPSSFMYVNDGSNYGLIPSTAGNTWNFEAKTDTYMLNRRASDIFFDLGIFEVKIGSTILYIQADEYNIEAIQMMGHYFIGTTTDKANNPLCYAGHNGEYDDTFLVIRASGAGTRRYLTKINLGGVRKTMNIPGASQWDRVNAYNVGQAIYDFEAILNAFPNNQSQIDISVTGWSYSYPLVSRSA